MDSTTLSLRTPLLSSGTVSTPEYASTDVAIHQGSTVTHVDTQPQIPLSKRPLPAPSLDDYKITKARVRKNILIGALIGFAFLGVGAVIGALIAKIRITRTPEQELTRQLKSTASRLQHLERQLAKLDAKVNSSWQDILKVHAFESVDDLKTKAAELRAEGQNLSDDMAKDRGERTKVRNTMYTMEAPIRKARQQLWSAEAHRDHVLENHKSGILDLVFGDPRQDACDEVSRCKVALRRAENSVYGSQEYKNLEREDCRLSTQISKNQKNRKSVSSRLSPLAQHEFKLARLARLQQSCDNKAWEKAKHEMNYREFVEKKGSA